jgi:hypothetical protein
MKMANSKLEYVVDIEWRSAAISGRSTVVMVCATKLREFFSKLTVKRIQDEKHGNINARTSPH